MSDKPLVSIVTPCYNGEAYLDRFFRSIMAQTWPSIELIFVDDGSTDTTLAVAESWRDRLEGRGIAFRLLTHPNGGQASAMNVGLPYVSGKYVTWPDSDDLMDPKNLELKAEYLEAHPEKGLVVCDISFVDESDPGAVVNRCVFDDSRPRLFDGLIRENKGIFCSDIAYMARADALFRAIGGRRIYESRSGQNWQLLFPLTYHNDCGFIHKDLATYVVRGDSHSHSYVSLEDQMRRTHELEDIIVHVLPSMGMSDIDLSDYMGYAKRKYLPQRFEVAVKMGNRGLARDLKADLDAFEGKSLKRELMAVICDAGFAPVCFAMARATRGAVRLVKNMIGRIYRHG